MTTLKESMIISWRNADELIKNAAQSLGGRILETFGDTSYVVSLPNTLVVEDLRDSINLTLKEAGFKTIITEDFSINTVAELNQPNHFNISVQKFTEDVEDGLKTFTVDWLIKNK